MANPAVSHSLPDFQFKFQEAYRQLLENFEFNSDLRCYSYFRDNVIDEANHKLIPVKKETQVLNSEDDGLGYSGLFKFLFTEEQRKSIGSFKRLLLMKAFKINIFDTVKKTRVLQDRTTLVEVEVKYPQLPSIFNFEDNVNDINSRLPALLEEANGTLRPVSIIINQQGISFYFSKWWEKSDRFEELCGASDEQREKFIQRTEKAYCWMDNGFHAKMVERFGTEQYSYQIMTVDFKSVFGTYYLAYPDRKKFVYMVEAERYMKKLIASIESLKQEDLEKDSATIFLSRTPFNQDSVEGVFSSVVAECLDDIRAMFPQYAFSRQSSGSNLLLVVNLKQPD